MKSDPPVRDWNTIDHDKYSRILLGNGFSTNIWSGFSYNSLFEQAHLSADSKSLFSGFDTKDFERVLECLTYANTAMDCLGLSASRIIAAYDEVKKGLFSTVSKRHIPWMQFTPECHVAIINYLNSLARVFTTNYDLCLYWSQMWCIDKLCVPNGPLVDFFWNENGEFLSANTSVWNKSATCFYYLHGGLHLTVDAATDQTFKRLAREAKLLNPDNSQGDEFHAPLFVSEGSSRQKKLAIDKNEYLTFCLESLVHEPDPIIIFGHALQVQDSHIINAINESEVSEVAVSVYHNLNNHQAMEYVDYISSKLPKKEIEFFKSNTHPLGHESLHLG